MCENNKRNITINILPQDSASWFFIAMAIGAVAIFNAVKHLPDSNSVEITQIQAEAEIQKAKILAGQAK